MDAAPRAVQSPGAKNWDLMTEITSRKASGNLLSRYAHGKQYYAMCAQINRKEEEAMPNTAQSMKLTLLDAAPMLGVSPYTLRAWVRKRRVPFYRCGRRIVVSRCDLESFLESWRVVPQEPVIR
jgi:excisionase family DNA binding protein